jgi:signal transduction histidine kinase
MVAFELTELLEHVNSLEHDVARLQAANRALDDFVAIAAHDLEAPRRAIDRALARQDAGMLAEIAGHSARLGDLLRDLLAYAQLAGERAAPEMVDIGAVAHSALSLAEHSHQFRLLRRPDVMRIVTDRVPLETIVRNLVTNAVRHHDAKSGMIEVRLDDQGHAWRLSVADDGPGIAARDRLRVFEPFHQIDARSTSGGAGLGLFLVATAARRLGGEVTIEERLDDRRGAVFAVVWPKSPKAS